MQLAKGGGWDRNMLINRSDRKKSVGVHNLASPTVASPINTQSLSEWNRQLQKDCPLPIQFIILLNCILYCYSVIEVIELFMLYYVFIV